MIKETLRTCVVCRKKTTKDQLLRFVFEDKGGLLLDKKCRLPGRGAYLHLECANKKSSYKLLYSLKQDLKDTNIKSIDLGKIIGLKPVKKINCIKPKFR